MYKLLPNNTLMAFPCVKRLADNATIPFDPANRDYQVYLKWLDGYELQDEQWVKTSDGNTPLPADEPSEGTA
jgi:hypothetical protein